MNKTKYFLVCLIMGAKLSLWAQSPPSFSDFISPVDHNIVLAGSFAELRSSHFHAGIDIKPRNKKSIDTIRCVAEGYVSRIKVQSGGYGQAIYIDHPNGYTSVYAHLKKLNPKLGSFVRGAQKKAESYSVDIYLDRNKFTFHQGDAIGLMGNTGNSYAKHLHFELRETESEKPINPALFGIKPQDTRPPNILSVDLHALSPDYQVTNRKTFYPKKISKGKYTISDNPIVFPAWRMGLCVQTFDKMDGAENNNGVYAHRIFVDEQLYYEYIFDKLDWEEMEYIHAHIDYETRKNQNRTVTKGYVTPGNKLSAYNKLVNQGMIELYKNKPRNISVEIQDIEGNTSTLSLQVLRSKDIPEFTGNNFNQKIEVGKTVSIKNNGMIATIPKNALEKNTYLSYGKKQINKNESQWYIGDETLILLSRGKITLPLPNYTTGREEKAVIAYLDKNGNWKSLGGTVQDKTITTTWNKGGNYRVMVDDTKPIIKSLSNTNKTYSKENTLKFSIKDAFASDLQIRVEINDKWHIAPFKQMTSILQVPLSENTKSGKNKIVISVSDDRGNTTIWTQMIEMQ